MSINSMTVAGMTEAWRHKCEHEARRLATEAEPDLRSAMRLAVHAENEVLIDEIICLAAKEILAQEIEKTAEQLADQILAEVKAETLAYKSTARLRLRRLISFVDQWQEKCPDDDERTQLVGICTELLMLCDHLGLVVTTQQAGGAA